MNARFDYKCCLIAFKMWLYLRSFILNLILIFALYCNYALRFQIVAGKNYFFTATVRVANDEGLEPLSVRILTKISALQLHNCLLFNNSNKIKIVINYLKY